MKWNLDNIRFLHPPYDFVGSFSNELMQQRHKAMQDRKIAELMAALKSAELPADAMRTLNPSEHITFVHNNLKAFRETESLETTVLQLYYRKNTPFAPAGRHDEWLQLFELCDRSALLALGHLFPTEGTTAYRGSITNNPWGLSWTTDVKEARWILKRWEDKHAGGGTVYSARILPQDILTYTVDNTRQEILLKPERMEKISVDIITTA